MNSQYKILFFSVLLISFLLIVTLYTSADLRAQRIIPVKLIATTLSLDQQHTANATPIDSLFSTTGIRPEGFDVKAVRIRNSGKTNVSYHLTYRKTSGSDALCEELELRVIQNSNQTYQGKLKNLSVESQLQKLKSDDWIFFLSFNNSQSNLKNKTCEFDFQFKTYHTNPSEQPSGFYAIKKLHNTVTSWL